MPPDEVPGFFETFFALPERHRWTYLTARDDVGGTASAMNCLYWASNWGCAATSSRRPCAALYGATTSRRDLTSVDLVR